VEPPPETAPNAKPLASPAPPAAEAKSPFEIAQTDENVQRVMELFDGEVTT
jgi:hypothetical protein